MLLSLTPSIMFANAVVTIGAVTPGAGVKGDTIKVTGTGVSAGTTVQLYWDDVTIAWNGVKGLMNSTTADPAGTFEVWFDVPEATKGTHYLWLKDASGNVASNAFTVNSKVSLSASSGLQGDHVTVSAYGMTGSKDIQLVFLDATELAFNAWTSAAGTAVTLSGDGTKVTFTGAVADVPIQPGTFTVTPPVLAPSDAMVDSGLGTLSSPRGGTGTINYITGEYSVTFFTAPAAVANNIAIAYNYYPTTAGLVYPLNKGTTSSIGTYSVSLTVPAGALAGADKIAALDGKGSEAEKAFTIGPVIAINPTVAVVGQVISVTGRGFTAAATIGLVATNVQLLQGATVIHNAVIKDMPVGGIIVDGSGRFTMNIIIPGGVDVNDNYAIKVTSSTPQSAQADLELTKLTNVHVTPSYGPQGSSMVVSGSGFEKIAGETVTIDVVTTATPPVFVINVGTVDTLADGSFSKTFNVPATADGTYKIRAMTASNIANMTSFRIGTMYVQLSATSGPAGKVITITGNGFTTTGAWNATIGGEDLLTTAAAGNAVGGLISKQASIPSMAPGTYTVTIWDIVADIKLTISFTVTYNTQITLTPSTIANGFNVTIFGKGFSQALPNTNINFLLYNKTSTGAYDRSWAMNVLQNYVAPLNTAARVNGSGILRGYWIVPASATLSKGTYYVNATDASGNAYFAQSVFTIGDKHIVATSRKASFAIGETLSFTLEHTFGNIAPVLNGDLRVYNPSGVLIFDGDPLGTWIKTGDYYVSPYSSQTAGGNPMTLRDDAAIGTWSWKWRDAAGDVIKSGTFTVTASAASETDVKIAAVAAQVTALATSVSQLSTTVGNVATTANTASTAASAASTAASAAKTSADAATAAATAAGTKADAATAAANSAKTAADSAAAAANGLTTLVYAAIGASLVAALAAIVALMQISRKIA